MSWDTSVRNLRLGGSTDKAPRYAESTSIWLLVQVLTLRRNNDPSLLFLLPQENLISWIPENIRKKECTYFVESSQTSDSG